MNSASCVLKYKFVSIRFVIISRLDGYLDTTDLFLSQLKGLYGNQICVCNVYIILTNSYRTQNNTPTDKFDVWNELKTKHCKADKFGIWKLNILCTWNGTQTFRWLESMVIYGRLFS